MHCDVDVLHFRHRNSLKNRERNIKRNQTIWKSTTCQYSWSAQSFSKLLQAEKYPTVMVYDEKRNQSNLISLVSFPNYYKKKDPRTAESVRIFEGVGTPTISLHPKNQSIYSLLWLEDKLPYSKITPEVISHEERRRRVFKQMTRVGPSKKNI